MNQSGVSVHEPITVGTAGIALIECAARDLEDFNDRDPGGRPLALMELPRPS